jgi:hypothetical protein
MDEAGIGADDLGQMGQEGDDVVLGFALDFVDAVDVEGRPCRPFPRWSWRRSLGMTPSSASASQAWASISNQIRNFDSATRCDHFRAGVTGYHESAAAVVKTSWMTQSLVNGSPCHCA